MYKETNAVELAESGQRGEVREYGRIANDPKALAGLVANCDFATKPVHGATAAGHECPVVTPSLIPRKPGARINADRRDAVNLTRLHRASERTAVWVPDPAHEAMCDLVQARLAVVRALRPARQQLSGFLLGHGQHYGRQA